MCSKKSTQYASVLLSLCAGGGEREVVWAKEDVLGCLDGIVLQVLDRVLPLNEESRAEAVDSGDEEGCMHQRPSMDEAAIMLCSTVSLPYPVGGGAQYVITPLLSSPPPTLDNDIKDDDTPGPIPSNLSPASHRHIYNRIYMQHKHTKVSSGIMLLDSTWLKPGYKASMTSKCR